MHGLDCDATPGPNHDPGRPPHREGQSWPQCNVARGIFNDDARTQALNRWK